MLTYFASKFGDESNYRKRRDIWTYELFLHVVNSIMGASQLFMSGKESQYPCCFVLGEVEGG